MESSRPGADFESIVRTHQEKVRNICFRFVNNREDADDLAQEVFAQVYGALARFRQEADLATWFNNVLRDYIQRGGEGFESYLRKIGREELKNGAEKTSDLSIPPGRL